MKKSQFVIVEFNNAAPFVYQIVSKNKISIEKVVKHFKDTEGFNEERDSITFIDRPTAINL